MNKLVMCATVALGMIGSGFSSCSEKLVDCPFGYQIKVYVKTTTAKSYTNCLACNEIACLRVPGVKRLAGFIYGVTKKSDVSVPGTCGLTSVCGCNEWNGAEILLWDYDNKTECAPRVATIDVIDRIFNGDTATTELAFTLDDMKFAGFGKSAKRNGMWTMKYASGFCAGTIPTDKCYNCKKCGDEEIAAAWAICADESTSPSLKQPKTAAYGKWTIDWSSTIYNRVERGLDVTQPGPEWQPCKPTRFGL